MAEPTSRRTTEPRRVVGAFDDPHAADEAVDALTAEGRGPVEENDERDVALAVDVEEGEVDDSAERPLDTTVAVDVEPGDADAVAAELREDGAERVRIEREGPA